MSEMDGFDYIQHPSQRGLGYFSEVVRNSPGASRSHHPLFSFSSIGEYSAELLIDHQLDWGMGQHSPLERAVSAGVRVLTIGMNWWEHYALFRLAEHCASYPGRRCYIARTKDRLSGNWVKSQQLLPHTSDFSDIAGDFPSLSVKKDFIGSAEASLTYGEEVVAHTTQWMNANRNFSGHSLPLLFQDAISAPKGAL